MRKEKRSGWNGILTSLDGSVEMSRAPLPHQEHLRQLCRMETGLLPAVLEEPLKVFSFFLSPSSLPPPTPSFRPQCFPSTRYAVGIAQGTGGITLNSQLWS